MSLFSISELMPVDRDDPAAALARIERELGEVASTPVVRTANTAAVAQLLAVFRPGPIEVPVSLTLYKQFGRVRVRVMSFVPPRAAEAIQAYLADLLELNVVWRSDPAADAKIRAAFAPANGMPAVRQIVRVHRIES